MNSEINKWADRQTNINSIGCCGAADAHYVDDDHMRMVKGVFEVEIDGRWYPIEGYMLLRAAMTDPSPAKRAVVWYGHDGNMAGGVHIYCFALPTLS